MDTVVITITVTPRLSDYIPVLTWTFGLTLIGLLALISLIVKLKDHDKLPKFIDLMVIVGAGVGIFMMSGVVVTPGADVMDKVLRHAEGVTHHVNEFDYRIGEVDGIAGNSACRIVNSEYTLTDKFSRDRVTVNIECQPVRSIFPKGSSNNNEYE